MITNSEGTINSITMNNIIAVRLKLFNIMTVTPMREEKPQNSGPRSSKPKKCQDGSKMALRRLKGDTLMTREGQYVLKAFKTYCCRWLQDGFKIVQDG